MRIGDILEEKLLRVEVGDNTLSVQENPRPSVISAMLQNSKFKNLRGIIHGDSVFWWDSYWGTHEEVSRVLNLGLDGDEDPRRLLLYLQPNGSILLDVSVKYRDHSKIAPLIASPYDVIVEGRAL